MCKQDWKEETFAAKESPAVANRYREVRAQTMTLVSPLSAEDTNIQSAPETSPPKWHLAHTTWFFENFVLLPHVAEYRPYHPRFGELFNSYYYGVGNFTPKSSRGVLSRPSLNEILRYRGCVDSAMEALLTDDNRLPEIDSLVALGLHHEQQHQELLLMDIKLNFFHNPLQPAYLPTPPPPAKSVPLGLEWHTFKAQLTEIGHDSKSDFAYDNECPRHPHYLAAFRLASRLAINSEYLAFIESGGYQRPELWLSDGWDRVRKEGWTAPLYWEKSDGAWKTMTFHGMQSLDDNAPVCHVSYFEADAFARWRKKRLPTEFEWEAAVRDAAVDGNFLENGRLQPLPLAEYPETTPAQMWGDTWEWTSSPYQAYPGYRPFAGAVGEYNGKFMCNQYVLRGGCAVTPQSHLRATYRNFYPPESRWQFSGIRLAEDA